MKKTNAIQRLKLCLMLCLTVIFASCDDDTQPSGNDFQSPLTAFYSNMSSAASSSGTLSLTYNEMDFTGKEVYLQMMDENSADITLFNILPGEPTTDLGTVALSGSVSRSFRGTHESEKGTSFNFAGNVEKGRMTLELTGVKVKPNLLTTQRSWTTVKQGGAEEFEYNGADLIYYHNTAHVSLKPSMSMTNQLYETVEKLLGSLLTTVLDRVDFNDDGTITARIAPIPDGMNIGDDLLNGNGIQNRPDSDWRITPRMMAMYHVDGQYLYVVPQAQMIIDQLLVNSTRALEDIDADMITDLYTRLTTWFTEGFRFTIRNNELQPTLLGNGTYVQYEGTVLLYLDKTQFEAFFPLISLLKDIIPEDALGDMFPEGVINLLFTIVQNQLTEATAFEVGVYLQ